MNKLPDFIDVEKARAYLKSQRMPDGGELVSFTFKDGKKILLEDLTDFQAAQCAISHYFDIVLRRQEK